MVDSEDQPGYTWFKFYFNDWLTDPDVMRMTAAEKGIYIDLLCIQWRDNGLPIDCKLVANLLQGCNRTVTRWLQKWESLFPVCNQMLQRCNPKLLQLAVKSGRCKNIGFTDENKTKRTANEMNVIPPDGGKTKTPKSKRKATTTNASKSAIEYNADDHAPDYNPGYNYVPSWYTVMNRNWHDTKCCIRCDERSKYDAMPHCPKCGGKGTETTTGKPQGCDCAPEDTR